MSHENVHSMKDGAIGSLVFDNPAKHNALSLEMSLAAAEVLADFAADEAMRVIVLSGGGERAFISGGDIAQFDKDRSTPDQVADYARRAALFRTRLQTMRKPTIAKIRGYCLGGGLAVALCCDIRIAADDAQFGIPAAKLGIGYSAEAIRHLIQLVGPSVAKDMLYTARRLDAQEALRVGLANHVVPVAELATFVEAYAQTISDNAPLSILAAKQVIGELLKDGDERDDALCEQVVADCFASQDYIEGRRAFTERRKPVFAGR